MSWPIILTVSGILFLMISQFGGRLSARNALLWWVVTSFLVVSLVSPTSLKPVANILGIELVSNFVMASLILFLFLQTLEISVENTSNHRKFRKLVSAQAAQRFPSEVKGKALIVLPCYNEEENIPQLVPKLEQLKKEDGFDYCFVNDGSSDRSLELLSDLCPENFVTHDVNIGVSGVLMTGFSIARAKQYEHVVQCDSDGQHPLSQIDELVSFAKQNKLDLAIGSRFCEKAAIEANKESTTFLRIFGIKLIRFGLAFFGLFKTVKDPTSGFRVYSKRAYSLLIDNMPDDYPEPESLALFSVKRFSVGEMSVSMSPRAGGVSSIRSLKTVQYMVKVFSSLIGLRLRSTF